MTTVQDEAEIRAMFEAGDSYTVMAAKLHTTKNSIAGRCHRLGLVRVPQRAVNHAEERARDQRDIDILCDIDEGHSIKATAKANGVSYTYAQKLITEARVV